MTESISNSFLSTFKDKYLEFLKQSINYTTLKNGIISVTTPFLDRHNDFTEVYIIDNHNGSYKITDDGYTINDLELSGFEFNSPKRKNTLKSTANRFGVSIDDDNALFLQSSLDNMPSKKHMLLQCMIAINQLFVLSRESVLSYFMDDVSDYFDKNDIRYTQDINIVGKSGLMQNFDFLIAKTKVQPERLIKLINSPNYRSNIESAIFSLTDIQESRRNSKSVAIINDINCGLKSDKVDAFTSYNIVPLLWSKIDQYKGLLVS